MGDLKSVKGITLFHFTSYLHMMEIIRDGKIKLTNSNLLAPTNLRIENGKALSDTDYYKPVVWLTSSYVPERLGVSIIVPDEFKQTEEYKQTNKKRIRFEIPATEDLQIYKWSQWATANNIDDKWRKVLTKNMNYNSWYVTEKEIPISAVSHIIDLEEETEIVGFC